MLLLTREDIKKVYTMKDAIGAVKEAFRIFSEGKSEVPLRINIPVPKYNGTYLFMPAYAADLDCASLKVISLFPNNINMGMPSSISQLMLVDGSNGIVKAIMDGTFVTQLRTGAATGAAFDLLGRKDAKRGALIGTGGQAAAQLEAMITVRSLEEVKVYDVNQERVKQFVESMGKYLKEYETKIIAAVSSDQAIEDADLLITATPSLMPVFDGNKVKKGVTISCVGSYQPHMQELDPTCLSRADKIYFDSREAVLSESGDIIIPLSDGTITQNDFTGELGEVILGKVRGRQRDEEIIIFETVGIGTQDLVTAKHIYDKAAAHGIGTRWNE